MGVSGQRNEARVAVHRRAAVRAAIVVLIPAAIAAALWAVHLVLLQAAGALLIVQDTPRPADAIIVLGGDWKGRIQKGIELYRQGLAPRLVVTGGRWVAPETTEADYLASVAVRAGTPSEAIMAERHSHSTWQDAVYTLELVRQQGYRRVLLVTSDWHSRRASWVFRRVYGPAGIEVISVPSPEWRFDTLHWWQYPDGGETIVIEYIRLLWYLLRFSRAP